jgi:hypothetical protein
MRYARSTAAINSEGFTSSAVGEIEDGIDGRAASAPMKIDDDGQGRKCMKNPDIPSTGNPVVLGRSLVFSRVNNSGFKKRPPKIQLDRSASLRTERETLACP